MDIRKQVVSQINYLTGKLIESSFATSYNPVSDKDGLITWSNFKDIGFALKNQSYEQIYNECIGDSAYNFRLLDGALIQLMYSVSKKEIVRHRLAFFPNPNFEQFIDSPSDFEELHYGNELFSDMVNKKATPFAIRIDYDNDKGKFIEYSHSLTHLTLGNYTNCRIPVSNPVSPMKFVFFILHSFYLEKFLKHFKYEDFKCQLKIDKSITVNETMYMHIAH